MLAMRFLCLFLVIPLLPAQDFSDIHIEKVAAGNRFTEGPVWSREGYLIFSDVPNNRMNKFVPGQGVASFRVNTNGVNGNAFDAQGRLYSCESRTRRVVRTRKDGTLEVIAEKYEGKRLNAPNDIVVRKDGHVWFTDPAFGEQADHRELDFYGIFHITPKGELDLVAKPKGRPNGIALSPNGRILYVSNSDERSVYAYDVDGRGRASNERVLITKTDGPPDGLRVDEKGNLYVTCNELCIYSPEGKLIHKIQFPEQPRNCAFGDPDFETLYVTAMTSVYRVRLPVKGAVQY
jgi:gluconolactonase